MWWQCSLVQRNMWWQCSLVERGRCFGETYCQRLQGWRVSSIGIAEVITFGGDWQESLQLIVMAVFRSQVLCSVTPCHCTVGSGHFKGIQCSHLQGQAVQVAFLDCLTLKVETHNFTTCQEPLMKWQWRMPEELTLHLHCCENLRFYCSALVVSFCVIRSLIIII